MLIHALCNYYDRLAERGEVLPQGYSNVKIHYLVSLTPQGEIDAIIDWQKRTTVEQKGKPKEVVAPRIEVMPKRSEKPGIDGNVAEHRPLYLFGLNYEQGALTPEDRTQKARKSHEAFVQKNLTFFAGLDTPVVNAFRCFIERWKPEQETENPFLLALGKTLPTAGFAFCLSGRPDCPLHLDSSIKARWEQQLACEERTDEVIGQCAVLGTEAPIARIHDKIRGVPGGSSMGNALISINNSAETSYGHEQSYNSNISELAMKKYTEALNYLLADKRHRTMLDDIAVVHWAASGDERYDEVFSMLTFSDTMDEAQTDDFLKRAMQASKEGLPSADGEALWENLDPNVDFYIVGLKPNSARLAVKFVYRQRFGKIMQNLAQHQKDIQMYEGERAVPLWKIRKELLSPKSKNETVDPSGMTKLLEAILYGQPYPTFLLQTMVRRIRTDSDEENNSYIKMNAVRMGVLKACINRAARLRGQKEEITLALDKQNNNPAYLCGRLFAVLEGIQLKASNYSLNRTIKDTYFASASSRPAAVFAKVLRIAQYNLAKIGDPKYANDDIKEIMDKLGNEFPISLSLADQGRFMLGYYQQSSYTDKKIQTIKETREEK